MFCCIRKMLQMTQNEFMVIEFEENQLIILICIIKPCTANFINLGKIFDTEQIWKSRVKYYGKSGNTGYYSKYPGKTHYSNCWKCSIILTKNILIIANWHCIDWYYWFCHSCLLIRKYYTKEIWIHHEFH